jgi:hypothetical protein
MTMTATMWTYRKAVLMPPFSISALDSWKHRPDTILILHRDYSHTRATSFAFLDTAKVSQAAMARFKREEN